MEIFIQLSNYLLLLTNPLIIVTIVIIVIIAMILPGYQIINSACSSKFRHLALLVVLVSPILNFHHWPLLALLVVLVTERI